MTWDYPGSKPSFKFTVLQLVTYQRNLGNLSLCNYLLRELRVIPIYQFANAEDRHPSVPDYAITDTNQWSDKYFSIPDLTRFSEHCVIKLTLK